MRVGSLHLLLVEVFFLSLYSNLRPWTAGRRRRPRPHPGQNLEDEGDVRRGRAQSIRTKVAPTGSMELSGVASGDRCS
jgi:hypothetical protein